MEFWRAWSIPASGPEFPQPGLLDTLETIHGEVRISIRVLNTEAPDPRVCLPDAENADQF
jgi:hypothetical protein